jgi:hypothetical protein
MIRRLLFIVPCSALAVVAAAAAESGGTWPCVQRKVPQISLTSVWTIDPPGEAAARLKSDERVADLAERLAARRLPLPEAIKLVESYASTLTENRREHLEGLFLALFDKLNSERGSVMDGIERYGRKQLQFAEKLRGEQETLAAKRADPGADASEIQDLTEELTWNTRIFEDRRKSLTYVCEVPVIIEQRLFALAKAIQQQLN